MRQLVGVHGVGQEYRGRQQILNLWTPALADGLEWATGHPPANPPDLGLAFYGHLFRSAAGATTAKGPAGGQGAAGLGDLDPEELSELTGAVLEIAGPDILAATAAGTGQDKAVMWLPLPVQRLAAAIERRFTRASGITVLGALRQVRSYLRDPRLKADVDRITAAAAAGCTVLIGHSLGSVVAYEFLRQNQGHSVRLLLTAGSPLGLRMVRDRLPAGEAGEAGEVGVAQWVNIRDPHDPVTAAGALGRWYQGVPDRLADNGWDAHAAERYLSSKAFGEALIEVLPELGR